MFGHLGKESFPYQHLAIPYCLKIGVWTPFGSYRITKFGSTRPRPKTQPKLANLEVYLVGKFGANVPTIRTVIWDSVRTLDGFLYHTQHW